MTRPEVEEVAGYCVVAVAVSLSLWCLAFGYDKYNKIKRAKKSKNSQLPFLSPNYQISRSVKHISVGKNARPTMFYPFHPCCMFNLVGARSGMYSPIAAGEDNIGRLCVGGFLFFFLIPS